MRSKMKLSLLYPVVLLLIGVFNVSAQDGSLTVGTFFDVLSPLDTTTQLSGSMMAPDGDVAYFFSTSQPTLWWVNTTEALDVELNLTASVNSININDYTAVPQTGVLDAQTGIVYLASSDKVYKIDPVAYTVDIVNVPNPLYFQPLTSAVDNTNRFAYFPSALFPSTLVRLNFTSGNSTNTTLASDTVISSVIDEQRGFLYLGSATGDIEKIDLTTFQSVQYVPGFTYNPNNATTPTLKRRVGVLDSTRNILYFCTDVGSQGTTRLDAFDPVTLEIIDNITLPVISATTSCGSATIDEREGEIFLGLSDSSAGVVIAINLVTNVQRDFAALFALDGASTSVIVAAFHPENFGELEESQVVYMVTGSQIISVNYLSTCPNDCSENGICNFGSCECFEGWLPGDCSEARCEADCYGNGNCTNGQCVCFSEWTSLNCSVRQCPSGCSGHGICSNEPDYVCGCTGGWSGIDCSTTPPPPPPPKCNQLTTVSNCVGFDYCGWCEDDKVCKEGSIRGPYYGSCKLWYWNQNLELGVIVLAAIFLFIVFIMFMINWFSAIRLDLRRGADLEKEYSSGVTNKPSHAQAAALWWRDQRSAKTWLLIDQFQFLVLVSHMALDFPARFLSFTKLFDWTNFGLPLPFVHDDGFHAARVKFTYPGSTTLATQQSYAPTNFVTRDLQGFEQYGNSLGLAPNDLFGSNMFWFGICLAIACILYGTIILINTKKAHWKVVFTCRLVYVLIRIVNMGYMGIVMTSAYGIVSPGHNASLIAPSAVAFVVIGGGWPLLVWFVLHGKGKSKELFSNEFKYKVGSLYVNYKPEHSMFSLYLIFRRFVTGAIVGFLAYSPTQTPQWLVIIQFAVMTAVQIFYGVLVAWKKPYYDYYHEYLEYFLCIVNLATLGLSMSHYNGPKEIGELLTALVQALALIACFGTYIVSWLQMHKDFSFSEAIKRCFGRGSNADINSSKDAVPLDHDNI